MKFLGGHLISEQDPETLNGGRNFPANFSNMQIENYSDLKNIITEKKSEELHFFWFTNTSLYSIICYLPQAVGILFGKILNLPYVIQAYLGRITNFITYLFITYFALKMIPTKNICLHL